MKIKLTLLHLAITFLFISNISAQDLYTGVWRSGTDGYALYGGLTWSSFVNKWTSLASSNLRLVDISTYTKNGVRYYNGVWRAGTDGYALYGGVNWTDFVAKWQELGAQGLRLIDIETYLSGTTRLYVGVWRAGTDGYYLYGGLNWSDFVTKWQQLGAANYRLIDVASYLSGTTRLYIGVWRYGTDGYALYNGLNWSQFTAKWQELAAQNLRLINISSYISGGVRVYIGVWRGGTDSYALWNGTDWESTTSKWAELGSKSLRLINLETYDSQCADDCLNNVLMDDNPNTSGRDTYNYGITAGTYHCEGKPGTCPIPSPGDVVYYRWPNLKIGSTYYSRNSVLFDAKDQLFTLPFTEAASNMNHNGWLYSPGSWHHALDYSKKVVGTFQITAAAPGRVIYIGWDNWSGNTMVISHDVGTKKDVYRTIYMHLRNGPSNDCSKAWSATVPTLSGTNLTNYKNYLNSTGCPMTVSQRNPDQPHWGTNSQKIDMTLLNKTVTAGQAIAWAGSTGPGGCGCTDGTTNENTHLHIFYAHRDPVDGLWYFFDPYGIYSYPTCYPTGVADAITTECARYPISWKTGKPSYPLAPNFFPEPNEEPIFAANVTGLTISPNPSFGNITVGYKSDKAGKVNLTVYDKTGVAVFSKIDYAGAGDNSYRLDLPRLISGVYYLEVNNDGVKTRDKFIIDK